MTSATICGTFCDVVSHSDTPSCVALSAPTCNQIRTYVLTSICSDGSFPLQGQYQQPAAHLVLPFERQEWQIDADVHLVVVKVHTARQQHHKQLNSALSDCKQLTMATICSKTLRLGFSCLLLILSFTDNYFVCIQPLHLGSVNRA